MATHGDDLTPGPTSGPTPEEARELLGHLASDEEAVRYPPISAWFFAVQSAVVGALFLVRLLPSDDASRATLALGIVAVLLGSRYWFNRDGVSWATAKLADMVPFLLVLLLLAVGCLVVDATTAASWVWAVGAALAAGVVWRTGQVYRRDFGDGA